MQFPDMVPVITASVSGLFLLAGYIFQKSLEHRRIVAEKRRETYSSFLKSTFVAMEARIANQQFDASDEVFWKAQVSLYGSDAVVRKLGKLTRILSRRGEAKRPTSTEVPTAFDELILAMRRDITPRTSSTLDEIRAISPILEN